MTPLDKWLEEVQARANAPLWPPQDMAQFRRDAREALALIRKMKAALEAIKAFEPHEVIKDDFAYDRLVESYREAARAALSGEVGE